MMDKTDLGGRPQGYNTALYKELSKITKVILKAVLKGVINEIWS